MSADSSMSSSVAELAPAAAVSRSRVSSTGAPMGTPACSSGGTRRDRGAEQAVGTVDRGADETIGKLTREPFKEDSQYLALNCDQAVEKVERGAVQNYR